MIMMMRSKHNDHHLQKQHQIKTTAIFLPIMCSNDVAAALPSHRRRRRRPSAEPSSPKVGCMGQVRRTSKVVAFPSSVQNCSSNNNNKRLFFSPKSISGSPSTAAQTTAGGTHYGGRKATAGNSSRVRSETVRVCRSRKSEIDKGSVVNLEELDPPLPVVKRLPATATAAEKEEEKSLWKRRSGGVPLRSLQVQVVHQNQTSFLPAANTV